MAWFGDGLSSLSNLKGQITNFTKEVLSEGIVEEIGDFNFINYYILIIYISYNCLSKCHFDINIVVLSKYNSAMPTEIFM